MPNRLQTIIPAAFQPIDPIARQDHPGGERIERLTAFLAVALAVLVVGLIAMLMGMT
jgi:hypothetical protein